MNTNTAVTFAVLLPALLVAHQVADHWVQTHAQACAKGAPGWPGRRACAAHVATYTAVTAGVVALLWAGLRLPIGPAGFVVGQLASAVSHYWADRRTTLARLAEAIGKGDYYRLGQPRRVHGFVLDPTDPEEHNLLEVLTYQVDEQYQPVRPGGNPYRVVPLPFDNQTLGTGAYALDQSWHLLWLLVAALATAVIR
jgi:hypothetical protein